MFNFITRKYKNGISIRSRYIVLIKIKKKIVKNLETVGKTVGYARIVRGKKGGRREGRRKRETRESNRRDWFGWSFVRASVSWIGVSGPLKIFRMFARAGGRYEAGADTMVAVTALPSRLNGSLLSPLSKQVSETHSFVIHSCVGLERAASASCWKRKERKGWNERNLVNT